jgi:hypothetical protein
MKSIVELITRVEKILESQPTLQDALDEAVHECKGIEASEINNAGVTDQIVYLGEAQVEAILEDFVENGSDEAMIPVIEEPTTDDEKGDD